MAEIRLNRDDADGGLPDVCMCCGEEATITKTKKLSWCPPWVGVLILGGLLPYIIVMLIMTKRARLEAPLCDQHKGHWLNRTLLVGGTFFLFSLIGLAGFVLANIFQPPGRDDISSFACFGGIALFVVWIIILAIAQNTAIRPKEITNTDIVLQGVSPEFAEACEDIEDKRRARRRKRRQQRDEEDEDEEEPRPRKRSAPTDAIQEKKRRPKDDEFEDRPPPRKKRPPVDDDD